MCKMKIDMEVLEKLWNGKLYIAEQCRPKDEEYWGFICELDTLHTQLLEMIDENSQAGKILGCYEQQKSMITEREHLEAFKMGFALAVSMVAEILSRESGNH